MEKRADRLDLIMQAICDEFHVDGAVLNSRSHGATIAQAREMFAYIVRESDGITMTEAARRLNRDRSGLSSAAKRMSRKIDENEELSERFYRIKRVLDSDVEGSDSPTLRDRILERGRHSLPEVVDIMCSLVGVMSEDTGFGFPEYLLPEYISMDGESKFRIMVPRDPAEEFLDDLIRTGYIAPELCHEEKAAGSSIVWSLGVLFFELLTGHKPFTSDSFDETPDVHRYRSDLPDSVNLLVLRALEVDSDLRIQSPGVFCRELRVIHTENEESSQPIRIPSAEVTGKSDSPVTKGDDGRIRSALSFVGRNRELSELTDYLSGEQYRLVSLVGPGGVGKSRLAYELAEKVTEKYENGVYFIPLNPIHSPAFIPLAIGNALGLRFGGSREPLDQLIAYLRLKKILLVLDDFDRLITGADQVARLIRETENIRILVTSRTILDLQDERVYELQGLEFPEDNDGGSLPDCSSVQLFFENATRLRREFELNNQNIDVIARICRLLEGVPLAIELASGWIRVLTPGEILEEIMNGIDVLKTSERDRAERHQSMRATFDRSWRMLGGMEQRTVSKLSVFSGGFSRDAAEKAANATTDILKSLVEKSLIQRDIFGRYRMHELLRQYAEEKLFEDVERELIMKRAHARYYGSFLHRQNAVLWSNQMATAQEAIERERANIDAGFKWSVRHDDVEAITVYVQPLSSYLQSKSRFLDGEHLFSEALRLLTERFSPQNLENDPPIRLLIARLKARLALQKGRLGKYSDSESLITGSLPVFKAVDQDEDIHFCIMILANIAHHQGRYQDALDLWKSIMVRVEGSESIWEARVLRSIAGVFYRLGDEEKARECYERSCSLLRNLDDPTTLADSLNGLGDIALHQGYYEEAREYYERVLSIVRNLGDSGLLHVTIDRVAGCAFNMGELEKARKLYEEVLDLYRKTGSQSALARGLYALGNCLNSLKDYKRAKVLLQDSIAIFRNIGEKPQLVFSLNALGTVHQNLNEWKTAADYHEHAISLSTEISIAEGMIQSLTFLARCHLHLGNLTSARSSLRQAIVTFQKHPIYTRLSVLLLSTADFFEKENSIRDALTLRIYVANRETADTMKSIDADMTTESASVSPNEIEMVRREVNGYTVSDILYFALQRL